MGMDLELGSGLIANDGRCLGYLITHALKHAPLNARLRTGDPWQVVMVNHDPFAVISVDIHYWHFKYLKTHSSIASKQDGRPDAKSLDIANDGIAFLVARGGIEPG
jgi:hypothetical protein